MTQVSIPIDCFSTLQKMNQLIIESIFRPVLAENL